MATPPVTTEGAPGAAPAPERTISRAEGVPDSLTAVRPWRMAGTLLAATILALLLLHLSTIRSMAQVWTENDSFAHCWFVAPLSAYMIWTRRADLAAVLPRPSVWGVVLALLSGGLWFLSRLAQVGTGEQVAMVGMIVGSVWALLGTRVCRRIAYPLAFLALMVPFGQGLFPFLINLAGRLAVIVLEWTGMPVTFDGRFLRVPGGEWTITEACSGLRYLLTILTVGAVFAYVNFRSPLKRALFLGLCVLAALITNGIRVWVLVVVGSFTDMKSPLVHDHAWLGWLLFAIMLVTVFQIGRRMADREEPGSPGAGPAPPGPAGPAAPARAFWAVALLTIAMGAGWTTLARAFDRPAAGEVRYAGPEAGPSWKEIEYLPWDWKPFYLGASAEYQRPYEQSGEVVALYVAYFRNQRPGAELIHAENGFLAPGAEGWKRSALTHPAPSSGGPSIPLTQVDLESPGVQLRVWRAYWVDGRFVASESEVKLAQLRSKLTGAGDDAAVLMLYTNHGADADEATARLARFLKDRQDSIERSLWYTSGRGPANAPAG